MPPKTLDRIEIWDTLEAAGGSRLTFVSDWMEPTEEQEVGSGGRLRFRLPRSSTSWEHVREENVVRVVMVDGTVSEWRIRQWERQRGGGGEAVGRVAAEGIRQDLVHNAPMLERVEANGKVRSHFELYELTPSSHMDVILEAAPSYFTKGTVEPTVPVDMIYHEDTPLSALEELVKVARFKDGQKGGELEVERQAGGTFALHLRRKINAGAETLRIRRAKNLVSGTEKRDSTEMGTRIVPVGGQSYGNEATMAEAEWVVAAQSGTTLQMKDRLIGESGQLDGYWVEAVDGTHHEITGSSPPRTIELATTPAETMAGTPVRVRRKVGETYAQLSYLDSPSAVAEYGLKTAKLERNDIPAVDNLVENPFLRSWVSGLPRSYDLVRSPEVSHNTDSFYTMHGGSSALIEAPAGAGVATDDIFVRPTRERPFFVAQIGLYVLEGNVRLELEDRTNDRLFPPPDRKATTVALNEWILSFGVAPGGSPEDNFWTRGTEKMRVRVVADGGPARFYLDAVQLTQNSSFEKVFYGGRASNDLWMMAKEGLDEIATPAESYNVEVVDLHRLDPEQWQGDVIERGVPAQVVDGELGIDFSTRVLKLKRRLDREGDVSVTLEQKENDLSRLLGEPSRRRRRELETKVQDCCGLGDCTNLLEPGGGGEQCTCESQAEGAGDQFAEHCSEDSAGDLRFFDYIAFPLGERNLQEGDALSWGWTGYVTPTGTASEPGGETNTEGSIKRTASGLIYRDNFVRDTVGADWTTHLGRWSINDDALYAEEKGTIELTAVADRVDGVWQATYWRGLESNAVQLFSRFTFVSGASRALMLKVTEFDHELKKMVDDVETVLSAVTTDPVTESWETAKFELDVTEKYGDWSDSGVSLSHALSTELAGEAGGFALFANAGTWFDEVVLCPNNQVTVNGLPAGYKVIVTGQDLTDATVEDGTGTAVHDVGSMHFGWGTLLVYDDTDTQVASITPNGGIFGGDVYEFDVTAVGDDSVEQEDTSGSGGLAASLELAFLDAAGEEISNTEGTTQGVTTQSPSRGEAHGTIPAGTAEIQPYAMRKGAAQGIACVSEPQINRGEEVCEFQEPPARSEPPATAPSADQLVVALGLDKPVEPLPWVVEATADNPITEPDGTKHTSGNVKIDDEDGDTLYSRRYRDASGRGNHGFQFNWGDWYAEENWPTPSPSLHGLGMLHPDGDTVSWPNGIISQCRDPFTGTWSAEELADFGSLHGTTWSCWVQPQVWVDPNASDKLSVAYDGDLFGRLGSTGGFRFEINFDDSDQRPFLKVTYEEPDGTTRIIVWQCDWTFGDADKMLSKSQGYHLMPNPIFFCLRISEPDDVTGTIDWDVWTGRQGLPCAAKVRDEAVVEDIFTGTAVLGSGHGTPPMGEPETAYQFCWMSEFHYDVDKGDGLMSSDGCWGLIDKCIGWQRPLEVAEINGLFKGMGDSLFGSFEFLEDAEPRLLMGAPPTVAVDTCAGGTGLTVTPEWEITESVNDSEYELELRYYDDGVLAATYPNVAPSARSHTHTDATVGSDAGTTAEHGWHVEADLIRLEDSTVIETDRTFVIGITYGTC